MHTSHKYNQRCRKFACRPSEMNATTYARPDANQLVTTTKVWTKSLSRLKISVIITSLSNRLQLNASLPAEAFKSLPYSSSVWIMATLCWLVSTSIRYASFSQFLNAGVRFVHWANKHWLRRSSPAVTPLTASSVTHFIQIGYACLSLFKWNRPLVNLRVNSRPVASLTHRNRLRSSSSASMNVPTTYRSTIGNLVSRTRCHQTLPILHHFRSFLYAQSFLNSILF
jgi:hypothetical protein